MERITVLIVDDSLAVAESLESILGSHDDMEVVGIANSGKEALSKAMELQPSVVLMDAQMPEMDGVEATRHIRHRVPDTRILFMAVHATHIDEALAAGADGFMIKDSSRQELLQNIRNLGNRNNSRQ